MGLDIIIIAVMATHATNPCTKSSLPASSLTPSVSVSSVGYDRGYDCDFVDPLPDELSCSICLLAFRNPHLLSCCGAKCCEECIDQVRTSDQPTCPLCTQHFDTMLDRALQRKILNLKVRCPKRNDGCKWEGELRQLDYHEREECDHTLVECPYACGGCISRCQLAEHQKSMCPKQPINVKLDNAISKIEEFHKEDMRKMEERHRGETKQLKNRISQLEESLEKLMKVTRREFGIIMCD